MTQKDEALKMAIEALESCDINDGYNGITQYYNEKLIDPAIQACKAALSEDKTSLSLEQATIVTQIDAVKFQEALDAMCVDKDKQIAEQSAEIAHYKAQINALREALETCKLTEDGMQKFHYGKVRKALAKTAPQCLQERDNDVIEVALNKLSQIKSPDNYTAAESHIYEQAHTDCWKAIRALKGKHNETT